MGKIMSFLNGKKTSIATVINLGVSFLVLRNKIDIPTAVWINSVLVALGLTANISNAVIAKKNDKFS